MIEDRFTTLTDIVFQGYGVTQRQFVVQTAIKPLQQVSYTSTYDVKISNIQSIVLTLLNTIKHWSNTLFHCNAHEESR